MAAVVVAVTSFAIKAGTAIVAAYKASAIVRMAIHIAATLAATAIATAMAGSGKINQGQELALKLDPNMPRQVLVGRTATGGSQAWAFTYGNLGTKVPNRYLVRIIVLSDRPSTSLVKIMEGNVQLAFDGDVTTGERACTSHRKPDNAPAMWVRVHLGSDTATTPAWLVTASGGAWTTSHKGTGLTYATVRYDYDPEAYSNGEPQLAFILEGAKAFDDRLSIANGGSQDIEDPTTWAYSENAAVLAAQLLRGYRTNGSLIVGAQAREKDLPEDHLIAAYNTCDQDVTLGTGGTEKRYRASLMLTASESTQSMLEDFKVAMDGSIYDRGGKISILPGAVRTPIYALTDEDVDWTAERSFQPIASLGSLYNQVNGSYVPSALNYIAEPYPIQKDAAYVTADGGQNITMTQDLRAVNSDTQTQRITKRLLLASRFQKVIAFTGPLWLYEGEQGDWFTMTSARWGFTSKYFEIKLVTLSEDMRVTIVAIETSPTVDGWTTADEVERTTTTTTPPAYMLADPDITLTPLEITSTVGGATVSYPVIDLSLTVPEGSPWTTVELQMRRSSDTGTVWNLPSINRGSQNLRISADLLPGVEYQVRGRTTDGEQYGDWTEWDATEATTTVSGVGASVPATVSGTPSQSISTTVLADGTTVNYLTVGWTAVTGASCYDVEINDGVTTRVESSPTNSLKNLVISTGFTYTSRVKAVGPTGLRSAAWSTASDADEAGGDTTIPPNILSGSVLAIGARRLQVTLKRPTVAACPDYSHALLYRNQIGFSPDDIPALPIAIVTGETYVDVNVSVGGAYYFYYARAVDRSGNEAAEATFLGSGLPVFTSVGNGDISPTDPLIVNTEIDINPRTGVITGIGDGTGTAVANLQAAYAPRRAFNFTSDVEGFTASNATLTQSNGVLSVAATTSDPILFSPSLGLPGRLVRKVRARLRSLATSPSWDGTIYYATAGHSYSGSYYQSAANPGLVQNEWVIVEWDMTAVLGGGSASDWLDSTILTLRIDIGGASGETFEIDWIAFGDTAVDQVGVRGIEDGADVTGDHVADSVEGQGDLALQDSADWETQVSGNNRPANNAGTTLRLIDVSGVLTVRGNAISNTGTAGYHFVRSEAFAGPCHVEMDITAASWNIVALSISPTTSGDNQTFLFEFNAGGSFGIYKDTVSQETGSISATSSGKVRVTYDGLNFRAYVNGVQVGSAYAAGADLTLYPKFFAYNVTTYTGLNAGTYTDRNWSNIGGTGRPDDYADVTGDNVADSVVGQGDLALLDTVGASQIDNGAVGPSKLAVGAIDLTSDRVVGGGPLATSTLTESKVQGAYRGEFAGDTAANTGGFQDGDFYIDTSLVPAGLKTKRGGTIKEVDLSGIRVVYEPQKDVTSSTFVSVAELTITVQAGSRVEAWWTASIETTPTPTTQGAGTLACSGSWKIEEVGSIETLTLKAGDWSVAATGGTNVTSVTIDANTRNTVVPSIPSTAAVVPETESKTYRLLMKLNGGDTKPLSDLGVRLYVQVQRVPVT